MSDRLADINRRYVEAYERDHAEMQDWAHHRHDWRLDVERMRVVCRCGAETEPQQREES